jgi:long-chain acyl-CoA synthetase
MFVSNFELYQKVMSIKDQVPCLKELYTFDHIEGAKHWSELRINDTSALEKVEAIKKQSQLNRLPLLYILQEQQVHPRE